MLWSKTEMKFLCCNWHCSKHISFLKSVNSWNITLLYGLQSHSETTSYMGYFQGPLLLLAVAEIFHPWFFKLNWTLPTDMTNFRPGVLNPHLLQPSCCLKNYHDQKRLTAFHKLQAWQASTRCKEQEQTPARRLVPDGQQKRTFCKGFLLHYCKKKKAVLVTLINLYRTHKGKKTGFAHLLTMYW